MTTTTDEERYDAHLQRVRNAARARRTQERRDNEAKIARLKYEASLPDIERALTLAASRQAGIGQRVGWSPGAAQLNVEQFPFVFGSDRVRSRITLRNRRIVMREDVICMWCRLNQSTTVDHVRPLVRGGTNVLLNLVGSCRDCNSIKGPFLPSELGWTLRIPQRAFAMATNPKLR